jgi:hypothetical protein
VAQLYPLAMGFLYRLHTAFKTTFIQRHLIDPEVKFADRHSDISSSLIVTTCNLSKASIQVLFRRMS